MRAATLSSVTAVLLLLGGCGGSPEAGTTQTAEPAPAGEAHRHGGEMHTAMHGAEARSEGKPCPMALENVEIETTDIDGGTAVVFTSSDQETVDELQRRLDRMAAMHRQHHAGGAGAAQQGGMGMQGPGAQGGGMGMQGPGAQGGGMGMQGGAGGQGQGGMAQRMSPEMREAMREIHQADVTTSQVEGGVRLELRASDPAKVEDLRRAVQTHVQRMEAGEHCPMMTSDED